MKFKPSLEVEEFIEQIHGRVGARNKAVLGRAALFLALGEGVPSDFKPKDSQGKDLDDTTVISDELRDVVSAALNHRAGKTLDESTYRQEFRRYFDYGCLRLKQIWEESDNDPTKFVSSLLKMAGEDLIKGAEPRPKVASMSIVTELITLQLLNDIEPWKLNEAGHNGLLVISGKPGTGKSQLALDLLAQASRKGLRFIFFDLKGELEDDPVNQKQRRNREEFLKLTGADTVRLIRQNLPINPLVHDPNATINAQLAYEIASLIRAYAPHLGTKQERNIAEAYQQLDNPDFPSLADELEIRGATGVEIALTRKIVDLNIFATVETEISPEKWLRSSLVIDFKEFGNDNTTKSLAVALILNFLIKRLNQNLAVMDGIQPLKMVLFVDEAHLLLPKEVKAGLLGTLARQGRSWGFPLWLASQDADKFVTTGANGVNFAELASCGIHFSPETLNEQEQRQILGGLLHHQLKQGEAALRLHGKLRPGKARQFWSDKGE